MVPVTLAGGAEIKRLVAIVQGEGNVGLALELTVDVNLGEVRTAHRRRVGDGNEAVGAVECKAGAVDALIGGAGCALEGAVVRPEKSARIPITCPPADQTTRCRRATGASARKLRPKQEQHPKKGQISPVALPTEGHLVFPRKNHAGAVVHRVTYRSSRETGKTSR